MHLLQIHEPGETPLPHQNEAKESENLAVGIDLGTTNSLIALSFNKQPRLFLDEEDHALLPSAYAIDKKGNIQVGKKALDVIQQSPERGIRSAKRLMGKSLDDLKSFTQNPTDQQMDQWFQHQNHRLDLSQSDKMVGYKLEGKRITPVEVAAAVLSTLKSRAQQQLDAPIKKAVVTVPAYFDDAARQATQQAAQIAGLSVLRLINEPTAAALAYGLDQELEGTYLIFDLGGGTFDVSLLKLEKGIFRVIATGGDTALGGDDIDHAIVAHWVKTLALASSQEIYQLLMIQAKQAKEKLCTENSPTFTTQTDYGKLTLSQDLLIELSSPLISKALKTCEQVLKDVDLSPCDVEGVVLVGGATKMPLLQQMVAKTFAKEPLCTIDPEKVVAYGAALQAEALTQPGDHLLIDVCPLSLGLETMGGLVEKLIPRNTPIPVSKAQEFTTYKDGQTAMRLHVLQGEREQVEHCRSLATFTLTNIPPQAAGLARIEVLFQVDANGVLTVKATEKTSGHEQEVQVKPTYGLSDTDTARLIEEGFIHAKMDIEDRLLTEEKVETRLIIQALEKALAVDSALLTEKEQAEIIAQKEICQAHLDKGNREQLQSARQQLDEKTKFFAERRLQKAMEKELTGKNIHNVVIDAPSN